MEREAAVVAVATDENETSGESLLGLLRVAGWQVRVAGDGPHHFAVARRGSTTLRVRADSRAKAVLDIFEAAIQVGRAARAARAA
jgi:hypothetical protein